MSVVILRDRWKRQPEGAVEIDRSHPLGQYAHVALPGNLIGARDACGNEIGYTGSGIYTGSRATGRFIGHNGASDSVLFWRDKSIGAFGSDDFAILISFELLSLSSATAALLGKGDTGAGQWMLGTHQSDGDSWRLYGAAGAVNASDAAPGLETGRIKTMGGWRVGANADVYFNYGEQSDTPDSSATGTLNDSSHNLTLFSADYDGTYDNTRIFAAEVTNLIILRGIGGRDVLRALEDEPYAIYKPRIVRRYFMPSGPIVPISLSIAVSNITASGSRNTVTLGF